MEVASETPVNPELSLPEQLSLLRDEITELRHTLGDIDDYTREVIFYAVAIFTVFCVARFLNRI